MYLVHVVLAGRIETLELAAMLAHSEILAKLQAKHENFSLVVCANVSWCIVLTFVVFRRFEVQHENKHLVLHRAKTAC